MKVLSLHVLPLMVVRFGILILLDLIHAHVISGALMIWTRERL